MAGLLSWNRDKVTSATRHALTRSRRAFTETIQRVRGEDSGVKFTWLEIEELLLTSDIGVDLSFDLIEQVKKALGSQSITLADVLREMKSLMLAIFDQPINTIPEPSLFDSKQPYVILVVGINGVGKTTSIGKLAYEYVRNNRRVVIAAADTFRAAATEQLQIIGNLAGARVVSHHIGSDPAAVAFDAFESSKAQDADVLIIDTAGRLHTNTNLMDELQKMKRVLSKLDATAPHSVLIVIDATTGQNGVIQAKTFTETINCTGVFLAKLDGTSKGGVALAIKQQLGVPIEFIGTGENLDDITTFDAQIFVQSLLTPLSTND